MRAAGLIQSGGHFRNATLPGRPNGGAGVTNGADRALVWRPWQHSSAPYRSVIVILLVNGKAQPARL